MDFNQATTIGNAPHALAAVVAAMSIAFVAACTDEESSAPSTAPPSSSMRSEPKAPPLYVLRSTLRCLKRRHADAVTGVATGDDRLRALRDLAQRTSVIVRVRRQVVGLAVAQTAAHAELLADLLRAPDDPYRIVLRRNAVLLFLPAARSAFTVVTACLSPRR